MLIYVRKEWRNKNKNIKQGGHFMKINRKQLEKELKKYTNEKQQLEKIIVHIKNCNTYKELQLHPISKMYGFEALRNEMSGYYSFNLCKNGGMIRLICSIDIEQNTVNFEFISTKHYEDFKRSLSVNR